MKSFLLFTLLTWVTHSLAAPNPGQKKYGEKSTEEEQLDQLRRLKGGREVARGELRQHAAAAGMVQPLGAMSKFAGIQYSPADLAEYILRTGDEEGVALAVEELYKEGLIDRNEAVEYLQAVKDVINYLQYEEHEQDITKEISPGRSDLPAVKLKRPMNRLDDSQVESVAAQNVLPPYQPQVNRDISVQPSPSSVLSTTEAFPRASTASSLRKENLTAVSEQTSAAPSLSPKSTERKFQSFKKEENKTVPEHIPSAFRHMKPGDVPSNFDTNDKRANHPMSPNENVEETTGHPSQKAQVEEGSNLGPRHPHQGTLHKEEPQTEHHQMEDQVPLPPRHPNFQTANNLRGYPQVKPIPQFMEGGTGADLRVFDPKELVAQQLESEAAAAESLYRPKQILSPRLEEVDELERYRPKQILERLRPYMPMPESEMEEKLRTVNSLYQEYTLEEVIYQLARNMFLQSLAQGDPSAEESLNKLVNFMEDEVAKKRISPEMKERILEIMSAALVETLKEYPAPVRNDPLQPYQPAAAEMPPPPPPRPLPHTFNTKPKPDVSSPLVAKKVKFMNKKSSQHE